MHNITVPTFKETNVIKSANKLIDFFAPIIILLFNVGHFATRALSRAPPLKRRHRDFVRLISRLRHVHSKYCWRCCVTRSIILTCTHTIGPFVGDFYCSFIKTVKSNTDLKINKRLTCLCAVLVSVLILAFYSCTD